VRGKCYKEKLKEKKKKEKLKGWRMKDVILEESGLRKVIREMTFGLT